MNLNYTGRTPEKPSEIKTPWKIYKRAMKKCFVWGFALTIIQSIIQGIIFWKIVGRTADYNLAGVFIGIFLIIVPIWSLVVALLTGCKMVVLRKSHESTRAGVYLIFSIVLLVLWIFFLRDIFEVLAIVFSDYVETPNQKP